MNCTVYLFVYQSLYLIPGFPDSSVGKESACNIGGKESEVAQSCPTLCNPMDCSLPGSSIHGIFQAIVLEWITRLDSWAGKISWRRDALPTPIFLGFPCGSAGKEFAHNAGDLGSIPRLWRSPPGRLPSLVFWPGEFHRLSIVSRRIRHDWATFIFTFLSVCLSLHQLHCAHVHSSHNRHALLG